MNSVVCRVTASATLAIRFPARDDTEQSHRDKVYTELHNAMYIALWIMVGKQPSDQAHLAPYHLIATRLTEISNHSVFKGATDRYLPRSSPGDRWHVRLAHKKRMRA